MALFVQSDDGDVDGANGYITRAEFVAYHDARGNDYSAFNGALIDAAIVRATDYMDARFEFGGTKLTGTEQTTEFPRLDLLDLDGVPIEGLPEALKKACAEYAFRALTGALLGDPEVSATLKKARQKLGPLEEENEYVSGGGSQLPEYPAADLLLVRAGLLAQGTSQPGQLIR